MPQPTTIPRLLRLKDFLEQLTAEEVDDPEEIMTELACDGLELLEAVEDAIESLDAPIYTPVSPESVGIKCNFCNAVKQPQDTREWQELNRMQGTMAYPTGEYRCPDCARCQIGENP